jgi:hypothetical protein
LDITIDQHTDSHAWNADVAERFQLNGSVRCRVRGCDALWASRARTRCTRSRTSPSANDIAIRRTLEKTGIEFIEKNGGGEGVRLKKPSA